MQTILKRYFHSIDPELAEKFVQAASDFIYFKMNADNKDISSFKSFYNAKIQSCIVKLILNREFQIDLGNNHVYFLVDLKEADVTLYGTRFENGLNDTERNIKWIHKGELLVFWPEETISKRLNSRLST